LIEKVRGRVAAMLGESVESVESGAPGVPNSSP
jgi:hypothetical protein